MEKEITQLEQRVERLLEWKNSRVRERLTYPLDVLSQKSLDLDRFAIIPTGRKLISFHNLLETYSLTFGLTVTINGKRRIILCMLPFREFTTDFTTDIFTNVDGAHNLKDGDTILLTSSGTLPNPLNNSTTYYVRDATGTTFKLALSIGGVAIDITNNGTDQHYWSQ